jgi:hypothetical protein
MTPVAVEMDLLVSRDERPIDQPAGPHRPAQATIPA